MGKIINLNEKRNKKEKKKFVMNLIFVATLLYIVYAIYLTIKIPKDTVTIESGVLTAEESATGYIIRDEITVKGKNYNNGIYQILTEGERAAKGQTIFRYYGKNESAIQEQIEQINSKIQKALEKENTFLTTDIKNLETEIDDKIQDLKTIYDVQQLTDYKKQISEIILKKATIAGENSKSGSYIKKLVEKREKYEKKLVEGSEYIVAPQSGVVSYRVDGLENVLKTDGFKDLTPQKLDELDVKTGKIVASSTESAKVINNFECYLAAVLNSDPAKQAEVGKSVIITLSSGQELDATIEYIKEQEDGKRLIIFKLTTLTDELISYRKRAFNITWWSASGLKVPNSSVLEDEKGFKYVVRRKLGEDKKIIVKVLNKNEKYSIISPYKEEELNTLGIDIDNYTKILQYDTVLVYPNG